MMFKVWLWLKDRRNRLVVSAAIAACGAVVLALLARVAEWLVPAGTLPDIGRDVIDSLLSVVASSMLAVATFSLGIIVSAYASAAGSATPRATELVMADEGARRAIGAFIAAFIYAIVAKVALGLGYYGASGRFVLFVATLAVLAYLVARLLLWVRTLSTLGRMGDVLSRIDAAARHALEHHARQPWLGGVAGPADTPAGTPIAATQVGYLTHIDMAALQAAARAAGTLVHVRVRPGTFVEPGQCIAVIGTHDDARGNARDDAQDAGHDHAHDGAVLDACRGAFIVADTRGYDQDPRFAFVVMAEVAQRALSPAVNDPGTAIQVLALLARRIIDAQRLRASDGIAPPEHDRVSVVALDETDWIVQSFAPIARDGASLVEVGMRVQKMLAAVARHAEPAMAEVARREARAALARGEANLTFAGDREVLRRVHHEAFAVTVDPTASAAATRG